MVEEWMKILDSITPEYEKRKLDTRLYNILEKTNDYRPGDTVDEQLAMDYLTVIRAHIEYRSGHEPFSDMFGDWMGEHKLFNAATGQFLTPIPVCRMMAEMVMATEPLDKPQILGDPASGTGRFMLAYASIYAKTGVMNLVCVNTDIDFMAYVFGLWNGFLNNIPSIHIRGDSLALKGWDGYAVIPWSPGEVITNPKCLPQLEAWREHPYAKYTMWSPLPPRLIKLDEEQIDRVMKIGFKEKPLSGQIALNSEDDPRAPRRVEKKMRVLQKNPLQEIAKQTKLF